MAAGERWIPKEVSERLAKREEFEPLTPREIEVLRHLVLGETNKEIATALSIGEETVKTHVANVLGKLGVENRGQATVQALRRGLVSLEELA